MDDSNVTCKDEEWRPVVGYEGYYRISNRGQVWSVVSQRLIKCHLNEKGYLYAVLCVKRTLFKAKVHRLVAAAFVGPIPPGYEVNHIDGVKTHVHPTNLEIVTRKENVDHATRMGLMGRKHNLKLSADDVSAIRQAAGTCTQRALAKKYGVTHQYIHTILIGKSRVRR